jgi:O-antigen/teichoic acid export membrane protein
MSGVHAVARRVAVGTASNALGRLVTLLAGIVATPIIVHAVGATDYGTWVLIASIATFGTLFEFGMSAGLVKFVAEHTARDEIDEAARMVAAGAWVYRLIAVLFVVVGVALAFAVPALLGLGGETAEIVRALGVIAALDLAISMISLAPLSVLKGLHRFPVVNAIQGAGALLAVALTVVAVETDAGIVGVSVAWALSTVFTTVGYAVAARRIVPGHMTTRAGRDVADLRRLVRHSRSIAVVQVAVHLQGRLDAVVIAAALPVRNVTPYSFAQRLGDGTRIATDQFGKVLLPLASEISATRERDAVRSLFLTSTRLTVAIALAVGLPIALLGGPILEIWVGDEFAGYGALVAILACAAIVDLPSYPAAAVLQSLERHAPIAWMAMASAIANVGLSIALVGPLGIEGVALGTLIASGVEIIVFVLPYAARVLDVSLRQFASQVLLPLLVPTAALAAVLIGGDAILPVTSLPRLAIVVGAALAVYGLAYAMLGAEPRERAAYRAAAAAAMRVAAPWQSRGST